MGTTLKPYHEYRESGLPWVGPIPSHWRTERAKWLFTKMERPVHHEDETVTCFRDGVVTLRKNRRTTGFTESLKEIGYQGVRKGDLVIHAMDAFAGAVGVSDSDGKATPAYAVCQPQADVEAEYHARVIREMARSQYIAALATGIRQRSTDFRFNTFAGEAVPVPPPDEQRAIARLLIGYERRVNRLIQAKRRLIRLLNEHKRAITHRAVTRGLNTDSPRGPLKIEGFGRVREDWIVRRAKYLFTPVDQRSTTGGEELLTVSSGDGVVPRRNKTVTMFMAASYVGHKLCWPGDLVVNSLWAWAGGLGFSGHHGIISSAYGVYRLRSEYTPFVRYLNYALRSAAYQWQFQVRSKGIWTSRLQLTDTAFMDMPIAIPPRDEAVRIAEHLDNEFASSDRAIARAKGEIELVQEYLARLTADVVTGRLDVRTVEMQDDDFGPAFDAQGLGSSEFASGEEATEYAYD